MSHSLTLSTAVLLLLLQGRPETRKEGPDEAYKLKVPVDLVLVPVTVKDKDGRLLASLNKADFEVLDEGVVQKISFFSADPSPLSVAILIDRTIDFRTEEILQQSFLAVVEAFSGFDEMAVYEFLSTVKKVQDFTGKKEDLLGAVAKVSFLQGQKAVSSAGSTPFLDGAMDSVARDLKKRADSRRKIIFAVSSGHTDISDRSSYRRTLESLIRSGIVVYGITATSSMLYDKLHPSSVSVDKQASQTSITSDVDQVLGPIFFKTLNPLKKYTTATGGDCFYPLRTRAFVEAYQKISQSARNQYVLGYVTFPEPKSATRPTVESPFALPILSGCGRGSTSPRVLLGASAVGRWRNEGRITGAKRDWTLDCPNESSTPGLLAGMDSRGDGVLD